MQKHDTKIQAEYLEQVGSMFGGATLVAVAKKRNVRIIERDKLCCGGQTVGKGNGNYDIYINSKQAPEKRNFAVFHELRHVLQMDELERQSKFVFCQFGKSAKRARLQVLMAEADAFTSQTLVALKEYKINSTKEYIDAVKRFNPCIKEIAENMDLQDDASFARKIFTEIIINGLEYHRQQFLNSFKPVLNRAPSTIESGQVWFSIPVVGTFPVSPIINKLYGSEFMSGTSMRAIETAFMRTLPLEERVVLKKYEKFVGTIAAMSQEEYSQGLSALREAFMKVSLKTDTDELAKRKEQLKKIVLADKPVAISQCLATRKNIKKTYSLMQKSLINN